MILNTMSKIRVRNHSRKIILSLLEPNNYNLSFYIYLVYFYIQSFAFCFKLIERFLLAIVKAKSHNSN